VNNGDDDVIVCFDIKARTDTERTKRERSECQILGLTKKFLCFRLPPVPKKTRVPKIFIGLLEIFYIFY